jgi:peptidoglycan/LPS O-acetylase OafA/YrhL
VAILLTAFLFGVIAWMRGSGSCDLSCYLHGSNGAYGYVLHNWWLRISQPTIANTPKNWLGGFSNASRWTLFYEFLCYLPLTAMEWLGMFRRRTTALLFAVSVQIAAVITFVPSLSRQFNFAHYWDVTALIGLVPVFVCGSLYLPLPGEDP